MQWSVIEFGQSQYIVCEDAKTLAVSIVRRGHTNSSVTVQVKTKQMSAKERLDYTPKSSSVITFQPGLLNFLRNFNGLSGFVEQLDVSEVNPVLHCFITANVNDN